MMTGLDFFKSQTTTDPEDVPVARMCCTFLFHWRQVTCPVDPPLDCMAGHRDGCVGFARSQMHTSPSMAPDARSFGLRGLNSNPLTAPWCLFSLHSSAESGAPFPSMMGAGFHTQTAPSDNPPPSIPYLRLESSEPLVSTHDSLENRSGAWMAGPTGCRSLAGDA